MSVSMILCFVFGGLHILESKSVSSSSGSILGESWKAKLDIIFKGVTAAMFLTISSVPDMVAIQHTCLQILHCLKHQYSTITVQWQFFTINVISTNLPQ